MFANFRQSMAWLHTWFGLVLGYVLMSCFFFGALSVFDREIDRWALPETRFAPQPMPSFDKVLAPAFARLEADPADYALNMPAMHDPAKGPQTPRLSLPADEYWAYTTHRDPVLAIGAGFRVPLAKDPDGHNHIHGNATIDPRSGAAVPSDQLKIGSQWFYPMHYSLNWQWRNMGIFIVGLAGLVMLAALVTGVIMHRKFFREFFTFRPAKQTQRSLLDLHNLTGVVALPFHFFFAFTGLLIFAGFYYFPVSQFQLKPLHDQHEIIEARETGLPHARAGIPAPLASVDAMMAEARRRWAARDMAGEVGFLQLQHMGDANGYVSIYRAGSDRVALVGEAIHFKASTGEVLREEPPRAPVPALNEFLAGLHLQHFEHWLLRWLYVLGGLLGCVCIATGFIFFVEKRKQQHARSGLQGARVVDALAVGCVTGMIIAAIGILVANRLLPAGLTDKGAWEQQIFWGLWALSFVHAALRGAPVAQARINPAWREQCWTIAALALAAVALNAITTGDHLLKTLFLDPYLAVAGVDLSLLVCAGLAIAAALKLARRERHPVAMGAADPVEVANA
ncbi:PepSY-associated TM helix domain-containing protein [Uliginosibacterium sp. 31-16]|uniref:PepSY-associated TM helix domain-containing protein n=1 Tax=Uliginosibacterium sp. 31-16 TaxID=3068315 RepID=UPI00273D65CD|nr:PepSY-associated TM helix domain-containing protein [Uliginosibacterium sp. 31-16]MDP5239273.1 PepSY-associated TM helix domain-containing protein [Uliginosibacterium sp. 31-16]